VGIGASAGGLEALETFFDHMPANSGAAFVIVQHLSPDFKSVMDELLARHTSIAIHRVTNGLRVEPDAIYLIPPRKQMIISNGRLLLSDKDPDQGLTLPINIFFRSLAQDLGPNAVGIVLSGTGSDGSRGVRDIHEAGGFVLVQDVDSARFDGMPKSACETGIVDLVLRPDQMPAALMSYLRNPGAAHSPDVLGVDSTMLEGFDAIFQLLRKSYDIDFSFYKRTTVTRRVYRRLLMSQITDLDDYVERLRQDAHELNQLYKDLLIGVTKFFRDPEAFERLEHDILPQLLARLGPSDELRIWVAGCATGEEAYSVAILAHELCEQLARPANVKIFATDVHRASLTAASAGVYNEASLSEVTPQRLKRYFTRAHGGFQVVPELRQLIVFAPHNLVKDAPFTKVDLITCRNLLIYLEPLAQKRVISLFHFALNAGGVMLMGPSESPGELSDEFVALDERWKIFRKRRDKRLPADLRLSLAPGMLPGSTRGLILAATAVPPPSPTLLRVYDELLKDYAPPCLLVNDRRELVQSFSGAAEFLQLRDGRPSNDVLELVVPDLKMPLSTALQQASKRQTPVVLNGVRVGNGERESQLRVSVKPLADRHSDSRYLVVAFEPLPNSVTAVEAVPAEDRDEMDLAEASREQVEALELELRYSRENLQATVEELETSNEELQATNEELVASNEELQSTNEELHSVNEELYTVNAEYQKKIVELTELTADLDNLLQNTEVGVIFLDREFKIRKFTPKMAALLHLLPVDVGRSIDSFQHAIDHLDLLEQSKQVLQTETPLETEARDDRGATFFVRILPYRTKSKIDGIVITLFDITTLKRTEEDLRLMSKVFHDAADPIIIENLSGRIVDLNAEAEEFYGWSREELLGQSIEVLVPSQERTTARELRQRCRERGRLRNIETNKLDRQGKLIPVLLTLSLLTDQNGRPLAIASIAKDITDRKRAESIHREAVRKRDQFLAMLSHELRNPLSAVLNSTYLLDRDSAASEPGLVNEACHVIQRQALQMARLLDDLLDVSRVTQGKIEIRRQVVDLAQLVEEAVQAVRSLVEARSQELTIEVSPAPLYVEGDPTRLLQIMENLLNNAAKYSPPHGRIRISLLQEDGEAVIRVRDNGRGIASDMLNTIFELFVQSDHTLDRSDGGMGLGLSLVQMLTRMHGGTVVAHSDGPNQGSEFIVRLPVTDLRPVAEQREQRPETACLEHVLIVEDNDDSRNMLEALLKLEGYQVTVSPDGQQGLEAILQHRPDVAIVDIGLPGLSGFEVARRVRQELNSSELFLLALTGYGRADDIEATRRAGFDAHLVKPLKPEELTRLLTRRASELASRRK